MGGAPTRLTPLAQDEPIGQTRDGVDVYASMFFRNALQRLQALIGQPVSSTSGGSTTNLTISEQLANLTSIVATSQVGVSAQSPGISARLSAVESSVRSLRRLLHGTTAPQQRPLTNRPAAVALRSWFPAPPRRGASSWVPAPPRAGTAASTSISWLAGQNPNNLVVLVAPAPLFITGIAGRLEIAQGAAATLTVVKAASGTAISGGTALHTGTFNANGTPATNQTLALSGTLATIALAAGDAIGIQTTGTWTTSTGALTITWSA